MDFEKRGFSILTSAFLLAVLLLLSINFASASITKGSPFFNLSQSGFGQGQVLEGSLNFSLLNEPGSAIVKATITPGNTVFNATLLNFLKKANAQFTCVPSDCNVTYTATSPAPSKTVPLGVGDKYFGLAAQGTNPQIMALSFLVTGQSSGQDVCGESPLKLDLLDDGSIDFEYKEAAETWCSVLRNSECFNAAAATSASDLTTTPYCQKFNLSKTGKLEVAVQAKLDGSVPNNEPVGNDIIFYVYDTSGNVKGNCTVEWFDSATYDSASCVVGIDEYGEPTNFYIDKKDSYFICVARSYSSAAVYNIKKETTTPVCGFYGVPSSNAPAYNEDYAISAHEANFAPFNGEEIFNETSVIGGIVLPTYVKNYIASKYNNDCTISGGCVIPMKFVSLATQTLTLSDILFKFQPQGTGPTSHNYFYDLAVNWPKLNLSSQSQAQSLSFAALNVTAPQQQATYTINAQIIGTSTQGDSKQFKVEPVPNIASVTPLTVIPGQITRFRVVAIPSGGRTITNYIWNWGDGSAEQTTFEPNATHLYALGTYTLTVKAKDSGNMIGSKSFTITSNITKELLNSTINNMIARVNTLTLQFASLELWYKDMFALNLTEINSTLTTLKAQLPTAAPSQLPGMKSQLDAMNLPLNITDSLRLIESSYYVSVENIQPSYIPEITEETYDSDNEESYKNAIATWQQDNVELKLSGQIKTMAYETIVEDKATIVNIRIDPVAASSSDVYLIFLLPSGVSYNSVKVNKQGSYDVHNLNDAIGFEFSDLSSSETVSLALPGRQDFSTLVFFASPALSELNVQGGGTPGKEVKTPWGLAIFFIILILLIIAAVLWFVWKGYDAKLEKKLFKNPGDVYNIMNFITNAQAKGMKKEQIEQQLLKAGWNKEQIAFAWEKLKKKSKEKKGKEGKDKSKMLSEGLGESPVSSPYNIFKK